MKKILLSLIAVIVLLAACSKNETDVTASDTPSTVATTARQDKASLETTITEASSQDKGEASEQTENTIYKPEKSQDISDRIAEAIPLLQESLLFDMSGMNLKESMVKETVLNAYFNVMSQYPALKYAYSMDPEYDSSTAIVKCSIKYMPYKAGGVDKDNLPAGAFKISNLKDLISTAKNAGGRKNTPIAIVNPKLDVDTMQKAVMQAGYGYIIYSLNNDATGIIAMPTNGRTMEQCISYIDKTNTAAEEIISKIIKGGMTSDEKVEAIYEYITGNVRYDQRYYTDKKNMPYESTTAYGALKDNLAICGGYSWAFNVLLEKAGIQCYNVDGNASGENHMWNIASYNDGFFYFDCTFDRGMTEGYRHFAGTAEVFSTDHSWDRDFVNVLIKG